MLRHIFPAAAFLDLENTQGVMVGKTPREIIKHLQDVFCEDEEKEAEVLVQEEKLVRAAYNPDELPHAYFKELQDAKTMLVFLKESVPDKKLIWHAINQFNKRPDLHHAVDEWVKKATATKTWPALKAHFLKATVENKKRKGTHSEIRSLNQVQENLQANMDDT